MCPSTNTQLTFSAPTLTIGLAGTSSGILSLTGSTSGNATITGPATAGSTTGPFVFSNSISAPGGSNANPALGWGSNFGWYSNISSYVGLAEGNGVNTLVISTATLGLKSTMSLGFSSGDAVTAYPPDTGISLVSTGLLAVGNGTQGDFSGTIKATIDNAVTGFQVNGAATSANYLRGPAQLRQHSRYSGEILPTAITATSVTLTDTAANTDLSTANTTPTVTGASTTVALSTGTAPTNPSGNNWIYTLAATETGAGSNGWAGAAVTISGFTGVRRETMAQALPSRPQARPR